MIFSCVTVTCCSPSDNRADHQETAGRGAGKSGRDQEHREATEGKPGGRGRRQVGHVTTANG